MVVSEWVGDMPPPVRVARWCLCLTPCLEALNRITNTIVTTSLNDAFDILDGCRRSSASEYREFQKLFSRSAHRPLYVSASSCDTEFTKTRTDDTCEIADAVV